MSTSALPPEVFAQVTQAWAVQDYALGERLLAEARKTYPDHWHLRTCHAAALAYCSRIHTARAEFDRLLEDAPAEKKLHMHGLLGVEWCRIGRHDLAIPLLQVAVAAPAPVAPVYEALANALEHVRDYHGALAVLDEGLRQHPAHPGLLLVLASTQRQAGNFELAEQSARKVLGHRLASIEAKARAGHELGHALDAQGRFAEAFAAYGAAKQVRQASLAPFLAIWEQGLKRLKEGGLPTREDFAKWQATARDNPAVFGEPFRLAMLVGCPRSGTTLLERVLDAHPELVSASETAVFNCAWNTQLHAMAPVTGLHDFLARLSPADTRTFRENFRSHMEDALEIPIGGHLLLDKNPSQLCQLPIVMRVFPEARILMAIRDPRAIAWSCYTQYLPDNASSAALHSLETTALQVTEQLRYWLELRRLLPDGSWHESRYEAMVGDFEGEVRRVLDFLGLPWDPRVVEFHTNPSPVRSPTYAEAALPIYRHALDKWRNYEEFIGSAWQALDPLAVELG